MDHIMQQLMGGPVVRTGLELELFELVGGRAVQETRTYSSGMLDRRQAVFQKVLWDLKGIQSQGFNALAKIEKGAEKPQLADLHELPEAVRVWAGQSGYSYTKAAPGEGVELDKSFMLPKGASMYTIADTHRLLLAFGCPRNDDGSWDLASHRVDPDDRSINGNKLMGSGIAVNHFGKVQLIDGPTLLYVVVSCMVSSMVRDLTARAIRVEVLEKIQSAFDSDSLGVSDELREGFNTDKVAQIPLQFGPLGFELGVHELTSKKELYAAMCAAVPDMGAHAQGKYFLRMGSVGIEPLALRAATALVSVTGAVGTDPRQALVGSSDLAKWFKRLTIGILEQCRLPKPDVGYCRFGGRTQMGRRTPVLVTMGGIPLPYLGASSALVSRKELGEHFAHYVERVHTANLMGEHQLVLPAVGTFFRKGETIVDLPGTPMAAASDGVLLTIRSTISNGDTRVVAKTGKLDLSGQVKSRSMGGAKESIHYNDYTGARLVWDRLMVAAGLTPDAYTITCGDVAVLGLQEGDVKPLLLRTEDGGKCTGKGSSAGVVALASETLGVPVDYSVLKHYSGDYNSLIERFEKECGRKVIIPYSVDAETAVAVQEAIAAGIAHKAVSYKEVTLDGVTYHLVLQEVDAYLCYDLCKVESTPVAAASTTQRVPGEVALAARSQGWEETAKELMARGTSQRAEYVQLWRTFGPEVMDLNPKNIRVVGLKHIKGDTEVIPLINLTAGVTQTQVESLKKLVATEKSLLTALKTRVAIGVFDGTQPFTSGENPEPAVVVLDPAVFNAFGRGDDESSMIMLARQILALILFPISGTREAQLQDLVRAILRLRGAYRSAATSSNVAKRINKGAPALNARSRAGFIPSDWMALSSKGSVAFKLARLAGWNKEECTLESFYAQGRVVGVLFRAPQNAATPQRVFLADCSDAGYEEAVAAGNWPQGVVRPAETIEPDTIVISREATAADNGDHDGDGRAFAPVLTPEAQAEIFSTDWKLVRKEILKGYQAKVQDPLVWSLEHDPKKLKWGTPTLSNYGLLQSLTDRSVENQTLHIGIAYNHAHCGLVVAEALNSRALAKAAQGLMFGHYEEQLAGLNDKFYHFYSTLGQAASLGADYGTAIEAAARNLDNHSAADFNVFMQVNSLVNAYGKLRASFEPGADPMSYLPVFPGNGTDDGEYEKKLARAVLSGAYRAISQGRLNSNILCFLQQGEDWAVAVQRQLVQWESKGSVSAKIVMSYLREVLPHVSLDMWNGYDDEMF